MLGLPDELPEAEPPSLDDPANIYSASELSTAGRPALEVLFPPAADTPEETSLRYSQSPEWRLEACPEYTRGYVYATAHMCSRAKEKDEQLHTIPHPALKTPEFDADNMPVQSEVPGCVRMVPGVPFVIDINGKREQRLTVCGVETPETLSKYPDFHKVEPYLKRFYQIVFNGQEASESPPLPAFGPLISHDLIRNDRSQPATHPGAVDGSFNLAATRMEGHGAGIIRPAKQSNFDTARAAQWVLTCCLFQIWQYVVPKIISKAERIGWEYYYAAQNVFGVGGLGFANSAIQLNISSIINCSLAAAIGKLQGNLHVDKHDDPYVYTLFILCFRLDPSKSS